MSFIKPRLPKGMRDFLPSTMLRREYVFNVVREVFHLHGFEPLQTPVLELRETLYGKYGEDAENLIFDAQHPRSDKDPYAMRYDLTVPLARVVGMYESELKFPFKRYHIAPVWRGERPQRGRYREFYQCDMDTVGVSSKAADAEIISVVVMALRRLGFPAFKVKINSRKVLTGMGIYSGVSDAQLPDLYRSVDKYDKIGAEGVQKELEQRGIPADVVRRMVELIQVQGAGTAPLDHLDATMGAIPQAAEGIAELRQMADFLAAMGLDPAFYEFDYTVVRGLGYYTGPIFEAVITEGAIGSVSGGGRYDGLIGMFRKESLPTTGGSLGIERIIDLMDEFNLYPPHITGTVIEVLVTVFGDDTEAASAALTSELRAAGIRSELYMDDAKFKLGKQFAHADKKGIPIAAVLGGDELAAGVVKLKRLADSHEISVPRAEVAAAVRGLLGR